MEYRFLLDGSLIDENPVGWDAMKVHIKRDSDLKGVFVNLDATLTFTADGYDYIREIYDGDSYCEFITISVQRSVDGGNNFIERYKGLLFLSDMHFDEFNCSVETKFTDDSFYGKIDKRRSTQAYLTGESTINGVEIPACTINSMALFDPANGGAVATVQPYGIYNVYDVLSYLVNYMTDGEVEFDSPLFGPSGEFNALGLTYGFSIRETGNGVTLTLTDFIENIPLISFETLVKELNSRFNIGMYIDTTGSRPKLIIDKWKNLFQRDTITTFPDLPNLKSKIAKEQIYSRVKFAGADTFDAPAASFPEGIRFIGFAKEEYAITGKCNVDTVLDLSYDFISSSNVIEQILILSGTDESYDDKWFLIDCDPTPGTLTARQSNWIDPTASERYYNERLTNYEISRRYFGFVPNSIAAYLGSADNSFQAEKTTFQGPVFGGDVSTGRTKIIFQDDFTPPNKDPQNNYDPVTSEYTAPNSGVYGFDINIRQFQTPLMGISYGVNYYLERYDSGGTFISETLLGTLSIQFGLVTGSFRASIQMAATDYAIVTFIETASFDNVTVEAQSTFAGVATSDGGGVYQTYNPEDYPIYVSEFTTEIFDSQTDLIISGKLSKVAYYVDVSDPRIGWIDDMVIDEFRGTVNAKLLRSRTEEPKLPAPDTRIIYLFGRLPDSPFTVSPSDLFNDPASGSGIISRALFFNAGTEVTITIPSTHLGCAVIAGQNILVREYPEGGGGFTDTAYPTTTATFIINPLCNYIIQFFYDVTQPGDTFPSLSAEFVAPDVAGNNGTANIRLISPTNPADFTFDWSGPGGFTASTQGITAPAGLYECEVTYNPGTFDTNVMTFQIEIPISQTGE